MRLRPSPFLALLFIALCGPGDARGRAKPIIYGNDDRLDVHEVHDPAILGLVRSTAVMIPNNKLDSYMSAYKTVGDLTLFNLQAEVNVCKEERFAEQTAIGDCTGFLVGDKTLVTAGHCMIDYGSCEENTWVFDYQLNEADAVSPFISSENIYKCAKVVQAVLDDVAQMDYAIVELDRAVEGRVPLKMRQEGSIAQGEEVFVIGHPSGLPAKVAAGAYVMESSNPLFFRTNLDTYSGNSGSPVFNLRTLEVEGILVRGAEDYLNTPLGCEISNVQAEDRPTEAVTRILGVAELFGRTYVQAVPGPVVLVEPFEIEDDERSNY